MKLGAHDELEFTVGVGIKELGIHGAFCVMEFDPAKADAAGAASLLADTVRQIRQSRPNVAEDPILQGFRELHTKAGVSNRKHVASPENLIDLVLAGRDIPSINPIVDVYNAVSLQTRLALGAHDVSQLVGPISLRRATGSESFTPLGSLEAKTISADEYAYIDEGCNEVICRLETRQSDKTKVSAGSTSCFFIVQGNANTSEELIKESVASLQAPLGKYCRSLTTKEIFWLI